MNTRIKEKLNIKALFVILLLTLSFVSGGEVKADDCRQPGNSPWVTPLPIFPGGQGKDIEGFTTPTDGLDCNTSCKSMGGTCVGSSNVNVNNPPSQKNISFCKKDQLECTDPGYTCSGPDDPLCNPSVIIKYGHAVKLFLLNPEYGHTEKYLPYKGEEIFLKDNNVPVEIGWETSISKYLDEPFTRCVASLEDSEDSSKWSGNKNVKKGIENLGNVPLYAKNKFKIACYFMHDGYEYPKPVVAEETINSGPNVQSAIVGTNFGSTILPRLDGPAGTDVLVTRNMTMDPIIGDAYAGGIEDQTFTLLDAYGYIQLGWAVATGLPKFTYSMCSLGAAAYKCAPEYIFKGMTKVLYLASEKDQFWKYLIRKAYAYGTEIGTKWGKVFNDGNPARVVIKAIRGGKSFHVHINGVGSPSGGLSEAEDIIFTKQLEAYAERYGFDPRTEAGITRLEKAVKNNALGEDLSSDMAQVFYEQEEGFYIGTKNFYGEEVLTEWRTLSPRQRVVNALSEEKKYISVGFKRFNEANIRDSWVGGKWGQGDSTDFVEFFSKNGIL